MSNPNTDLEAVIEDAVSDSQLPVEVDTPEVEEVVENPVDSIAVEPSEPTEEPTEEPAEAAAAEGVVPAPGAEPEVKPKDDFERLAGMPAVGPTGRENRIPYSRVKKITNKAVDEVVEAVVGRKLAPGEKAIEIVKNHVAQIPQLQEKVADYETRLTRVGEFENVMANEPKRFLQMLERVPAYKDFFDFVRQAYAERSGAKAAQPTAQQTQAVSEEDPMPEPNEELPDGSRIYNMEGIKALLAWNARNTEQRVTKQIEERYKPIESEWRQRQHIESVLPVIRKQIEEARTWPKFEENEEEITKILDEDPNISLEGAYRKVVIPKLVSERNEVRQQVIREAQTAPRATSIAGTRTVAKQVPTGPRKLEDIIAEQVKTLK